MKLQYGILGMVLVGGSAFAHDMDAEGIQVGGYVDARYTWTKGSSQATRVNEFSLGEGALYFGKRVGGARAFVDAGFKADLGLTLNQAYVSNATDGGLMWQAGRFDGIYGWVANDSGHYQLSTRGAIQTGYSNGVKVGSGLPTTFDGLLFGYNFSDMMSLHLLVNSTSTSEENGLSSMAHNMDAPGFGVKLNSKMDAFNLALGYMMRKSTTDATKHNWGLNAVAGTKFAAYDFNAIFVMAKDASLDATMGFGGQLSGAVVDSVTAAARVEWQKLAANSTNLAITVGPQFNIDKGFVTKLDYTFSKLAGSVNTGAKAGHTVQVAAVYDF